MHSLLLHFLLCRLLPSTRLFYKNILRVFKTQDMNLITTGEGPVFRHLKVGSGVGNNGIVPIRWAYPVTEQQQNTDNWKKALSAQGFTQDDLNQVMWLLK